MLALQGHGDQFEPSLDRADRPRAPGYVVGQQQEAAWPQHPVHLGDGAAFVGDGAQRERADHGAEGVIGEGQREGVGLTQIRRTAELTGPLAAMLSMPGLRSIPVSWTCSR